MSAGRKSDPIWADFVKINVPDKAGSKAKCKACGLVMQGLVARLTKHASKCPGSGVQRQQATKDNEPPAPLPINAPVLSPDDAPTLTPVPVPTLEPNPTSSGPFSTSKPKTLSKPSEPKKKCVRKIDSFVTTTTKKEKEDLDEQVARMVFATNSAFRSVDHPEFVKMATLLRPGYRPPSRKAVAGSLLNSVHSSELERCKAAIEGKTVCLSLDGWSNISNDPIVCSSLTTSEGLTVLADTVDTSGHSHTGEYLAELADTAITKAEEKFDVKVGSCVTDNAGNVRKMREELEIKRPNIITYGCSAHVLNLLSLDFQKQALNVKEHVIQICKFFKNNHFAAAQMKSSNAKKMVLPQDVRWNSLADCLESFIKNWPVLVRICEEHRGEMDANICNKVNNIGIKRNAEDLLSLLKPISIALDKTQRDRSTIADAVEIWKDLEGDLNKIGLSKDQKKSLQARKDMAMTPSHFLANMLDTSKMGRNLTATEKEEANTFLITKCPQMIPILINFEAKALPFPKYLFSEHVIMQVSPENWWKQHKFLDDATQQLIVSLLTAKDSSAGVERVFSSFGLVQSKLRNRLGNEKAAKLVFLFKQFNQKGAQEEEED